jgi:hypothetical protein
MSLPKDFWEQLPLKSDSELFAMLTQQEDYLPEALAAAKAELSKRNLAPERTAQLETAAQSRKAEEVSKRNERLSWPMRILIFILCAGILGAILAVYYDSKGYKRKAAESWITLAVSLAFHLFVGALLYFLQYFVVGS